MPSPSSVAAPPAPARYGPPAAASPRAPLDAGFHYELAGMLERAIGCYREALAAEWAPAARAEVLLRLARVHRAANAWGEAIDAARAAACLAANAGHRDLAAEAMNAEVGVYLLRGDFAEGDALAERALALAAGPRVRGMLLQNRGAIAAQRGRFADAERCFAESVRAFGAAGYEYGTAVALINRAAAARDGGDAAAALPIGRTAIAVTRRLDALDLLGLALLNQAHALADTGAPAAAEELLGEAYGHFATTGNALRLAECLEVMGVINAAAEQRETAARCFTRARDLADSVGAAPLRERVSRALEGVGVGSGSGRPLSS